MYNRNTNVKSIVEAGLNAALIAVIMLMNAYIPAFTIVGSYLLPIPITILYIRYNYKVTLSSIFVSAVLTAILVSPISALTASVLYGLTGLTLGYCIKKGTKVSGTIGLLTVASAIAIAFNFYITAYLVSKTGIVGIVNEMVKALQESKNMALGMYKQMGIDTAQAEQIFKAFDVFTADAILTLIPGMVVLSAFFSAYINYIITRSIVRRFKYEMKEMTPFYLVYVDNRVAAVLIVVACIGIILSSRNMKLGHYLVSSASMVLNFMFVIIGAAVVSYFLKNKYNMSKGFIIVIILFSVFSQLGVIISWVGIADIIFDFRKIDPNRLLNRRQNK